MPTITCPYCNAPVPVPVPPPVGSVPCPRCGEDVRVRSSAAGGDDDSAPVVTPQAAFPENAPPLDSRPSNWSVARVVLGVMLFMAALGLVYALQTTAWRRSKDISLPKEPEPTAVEERRVPPAEWPGLGYLPDDTQAVAGVRLAAALESEAGRTLLAPLGFAPEASGRDRVLGLTPGEVDHLLFAASLKTLPPRVTAVVETRQPLNVARALGAIQGARSAERNGKSLTQGKLWSGGPEGAIWLPSPRTAVIALLPEDFDKLPGGPQPEVGRFAAPLPELLERRVDPSAVLWLAAFAEPNNAALALVTSLIPLPPAEREAWTRLEALAVSIRADGAKLVLSAALRGRDTATTDALADAVARSLTAAGVTAERSADGDWRRLTATADAAKLAAWVRSLRGQNER